MTSDFSNVWEFEKYLRDADEQAVDAYMRGVGESPVLYKGSGFIREEKADSGLPVFVASEESEDRYGDVISVDGWDFANFKRNPVLMFSHLYELAPIGTVPKVWVDGRQLLNTVKWDMDDPLAATISGKYERGVMRAESVGFRPLEVEARDKGFKFTKQELLEISAVSIPAHPKALQKALANKKFSLWLPDNPLAPVERQVVVKGPLTWQRSHPDGTSVAAPDTEWDNGEERAAASVEQLQTMSAWVDPDMDDTKGGYKFAHHLASEGHAVVQRALAAVVAVLNGGRGGADIPDEDRRGVYTHIARHYREDFDAEPPELRSIEVVNAYHKVLMSLWEGGADTLTLEAENNSDEDITTEEEDTDSAVLEFLQELKSDLEVSSDTDIEEEEKE